MNKNDESKVHVIYKKKNNLKKLKATILIYVYIFHRKGIKKQHSDIYFITKVRLEITMSLKSSSIIYYELFMKRELSFICSVKVKIMSPTLNFFFNRFILTKTDCFR